MSMFDGVLPFVVIQYRTTDIALALQSFDAVLTSPLKSLYKKAFDAKKFQDDGRVSAQAVKEVWAPMTSSFLDAVLSICNNTNVLTTFAPTCISPLDHFSL